MTVEQLIAEKARATFGQETGIASFAPFAGDASSRRYYRAAMAGIDMPRSIVVTSRAPTACMAA
jgi:hypothetical protein